MVAPFWTQASDSRRVSQYQHSTAPASPLTCLLQVGPQSILDYASLVRLRVDVPEAHAVLAQGASDQSDDLAAAEQAERAACAIGQLHQVIGSIEQLSAEVMVSSVMEILQNKTLNVLCSKSVVAKIYKCLLPHQSAVGFSMAAARDCLNQQTVAAWDLNEALQTALIKTLTGCSSGTTSAEFSKTGQQSAWMSLSRHTLVGLNMLAAPPGCVCTAPYVEVEAKQVAARKSTFMLIIHAAGEHRLWYKYNTLHIVEHLVAVAARPPCRLWDGQCQSNQLLPTRIY